jgi:hypothetical protein
MKQTACLVRSVALTTHVCVKSCVNLKHFKQEKPSANRVQKYHFTERLDNNESNDTANSNDQSCVNWRSVQYELISIQVNALCSWTTSIWHKFSKNLYHCCSAFSVGIANKATEGGASINGRTTEVVKYATFKPVGRVSQKEGQVRFDQTRESFRPILGGLKSSVTYVISRRRWHLR